MFILLLLLHLVLMTRVFLLLRLLLLRLLVIRLLSVHLARPARPARKRGAAVPRRKAASIE